MCFTDRSPIKRNIVSEKKRHTSVLPKWLDRIVNLHLYAGYAAEDHPRLKWLIYLGLFTAAGIGLLFAFALSALGGVDFGAILGETAGDFANGWTHFAVSSGAIVALLLFVIIAGSAILFFRRYNRKHGHDEDKR